jgi:uncharacterized phiE125 gp8 family phage protein
MIRRQQLVTPAAKQPIPNELFDAHMRGLGCCDEGVVTASYLGAAVRAIESHTGLCIITQTWDCLFLNLEWDEVNSALEMPRWPVQDVVEVADYAFGVTSVVGGSSYYVDTFSKVGKVWPKNRQWQRHPQKGVRVRYRAGFGDNPANVPEDVRTALMMLAGHYYENRLGEATFKLPPAVTQLLEPYSSWIS